MPVKIKNYNESYLYVYNEEIGEFELIGKVVDIGEYDGED